MKKTEYLYIALLLIFTLLLYACRDKCGNTPEKVVYELRDADTLCLPYSGYDSLWFQVSMNDTILDTVVFTGEGKSYYIYNIIDEPTDGCSSDHRSKAYNITFKPENGTDSIVISLYRDVPQTGVGMVKIIHTSAEKSIYELSVNELSGVFGYKYPMKIVAGKPYLDISTRCWYGRCLLINAYQGILQFVTAENLTYEYLKKK